MTDPNIPGTEKLAVCSYFGSRGDRLWKVKSEDLGASSGLTPPMEVFNIKGWTRSLAATAVLRLAFESDEFMKVRLFTVAVTVQ